VIVTAAGRPRAPRAIEEEIRRRRAELGALAGELHRRGRELTNPRLLIRRHAFGVTVALLAVGAATAGSIAYRARRARRGRLRDALGRMIDRPEGVAVEPTATQRIIGSADSAAAAFLIKAALEHLSRPRQEARPRGRFARPSR
jgi:hypothetical protein